MAQKQRDPLHGVSGPGLDDYSQAADKSGHSLPLIHHLRQAETRRQRRQCNVARLHDQGPRVTFEFVDELARAHPQLADDLDRRLDRYAALDPALLRALGGDCFAALPLRAIGGGAR